MRVFDIGKVVEQIMLSIEAELEPDKELLDDLLLQGPQAIEQIWDWIDMAQADADLLDQRIKDLKGRKDAREQTVNRLKGALQDILNRHFNGRVKTALLTTWTQKTTSYEVTADPIQHPQFFHTPDPILKKQDVISRFREGVPLPEGLVVTERYSESVRIKRS